MHTVKRLYKNLARNTKHAQESLGSGQYDQTAGTQSLYKKIENSSFSH